MSWLVDDKDDWLSEEKPVIVQATSQSLSATVPEIIPTDIQEPLHRLPDAPPCQIRKFVGIIFGYIYMPRFVRTGEIPCAEAS